MLLLSVVRGRLSLPSRPHARLSAEAAQWKHQQSGETTPFYDPFKGWPKTEAAQEKMKMRELKNGRAAMLCWASFISAALIPGSVPDFCIPF